MSSSEGFDSLSHSPHPSGVRRWLLSCATTRDDQGRHGVGIVWMNWQRRGDFQALVREVTQGLPDATGPWTWKGLTGASCAGTEALVDAFFQTHWLSFDGFVVSRPEGAVAAGDPADQHDAHAALNVVLADQIGQRLRAEPDVPQTFRIWLDAKAAGFASRPAAARSLRAQVLVPLLGHRPTQDKIIGHRLPATTSLQLCDLLLGAVFAAWQDKVTMTARRRVQDRIATHLGWRDLRTESRPGGTKFNVHALSFGDRRFEPMQLGLFDRLRSSRRPALVRAPV